jgi:methionyl-tRNA synthetase
MAASSSQKPYFITTSIAYVNSVPHIGFAMELVQADVLARYHRLKGERVFFETGTDEHGIKIFRTANELGMTPQEMVDKNAQRFQDLTKALNVSNDFFVRTTDAAHKRGAQKIWKKMADKGDIYKGSYEGLYCVGCEAYVLEKDLVEGNCAIHKKPPELLKEDNYFFKLSKYSAQIRELIESDRVKVVPDARKNEILNIIGEGLPDVSFSRPRSMLPWGVEVPDDAEQVMYVWCDALSNYISGVGYEEEGELFKSFWPANVHLIGKDILRFHAGIWIGMLLSAELEVPKSIFVHGFITSEGQKMSKSLGNVVDPFEFTEKYGIDPVRYYLLKEIPTTDDGDFSKERFTGVYASDLANSLGNLVYRVFSMNEKYFGGKIVKMSPEAPSTLTAPLASLVAQYHNSIDAFDLKVALETVIKLMNAGNEYVERTKPWALAKTDMDALALVMYQLLELVRIIAVALTPFIPATAEKILAQYGEAGVITDLDTALTWGQLPENLQLTKGEPLFPRIEEAA